MSILVFNNEEVCEAGDVTIHQLLISRGLNPSAVMIRVDGRIIDRDRYSSFVIPDGAKVKAYPFVGGG